jgi:hypothetical protein
MGFFKKKADPISERAKALNAEIAALEAQIKKLDLKLQQPSPDPRLRSSLAASPQPAAANRHVTPLREPVFEPVDHKHLEASPAQEHTAGHYNDLGVRKYDLAGGLRRLRDHFRAPPISNPKLVTYLAAGSIRGLRPLRYEKRVARRRCIALLLLLGCLVWGIIAVFVRSR